MFKLDGRGVRIDLTLPEMMRFKGCEDALELCAEHSPEVPEYANAREALGRVNDIWAEKRERLLQAAEERAAKKEAKEAKLDYDSMKERVLGEMKKTFRPEFINRIDEVIVFHQLTEEQLR